MKRDRLFKTLGLLTIWVLSAQITLAQNEEHLPDVIPPSPEAASLGKFGEIPVSTYTGIPNISIPLHQIQYRDVNIPITMSYHAGGIRVEEEAGWVGLGWALSAGGAITRSVRNMNDFRNQAAEKGFVYQAVPTEDTLEVTDLNMYSVRAWDGQPDIFYFNFMGHSGKFVLEHGTPVKVHLLSDEKMKFDYDLANQRWTVWNKDGYKFIFGTREYTRSLVPFTGTNEPAALNFGGEPDGTNDELDASKDFISAWYLDEVVTPLGEIVTFEYDGVHDGSNGFKYGTKSVKSTTEKRVWGCTNEVTYIVNQTLTHNIYLSKINYANGSVTFTTSDRQDMLPYQLPGDYNNKVYAIPRKLDQITVENNSGPIKRIDFNYLYFNDATDDFLEERLKLVSLQESNGSETKPPYAFTYNEDKQLPEKNSYARDLWGFYNEATGNASAGPAGNATLIPEEVYDDAEFGTLGADRSVNEAAAQAAILTRIEYPTGGFTEFDYESNEFNRNQFTQTPPTVSRSFFANQGTSKIFELQTTTSVSASYHLDCDCPSNPSGPCDVIVGSEPYANLINLNTGTSFPRVLSDWHSREPDTACFYHDDDNFNLSPGRYLMQFFPDYPQGHPQGFTGNMTITYEESQPVNAFNQNLIEKAGGLRIKEIRDSDGLGATGINVKRYLYTTKAANGEIITTGKLMSEPHHGYHQADFIWNPSEGGWDVCDNLIATSYSNLALGSSAQGALVGYDHVTELHGINGDYGRSVFYYKNKPDEEPEPFLPNAPTRDHSPSNGLLVKEEHFDRNGFKVREVTNTYDSIIEGDLDALRSLFVLKIRNSIFYRFYQERSEWWKPTQTIEKNYDRLDANNLKTFTVTTNNQYNNSDHKQLTTTTQTDSEGRTVRTDLKYPLDEQTLAPPEMWDENNANYKHMHSPVIRQETFVNGALTSGVLTYYGYNGTSDRVLRDSINQSFTGGTYEKVVEFKTYDEKGNLVEFSRPGDVVTSFLWGYDQTLPIAQVVNATYAQFTGALNSGDLSLLQGSSLTATQVRDKLAVLRTNLPDAQVTVYTYDPHLGISSVTDPNGITTHYDYDDLGRLEVVQDHQLNKLQQIDYQYHTN